MTGASNDILEWQAIALSLSQVTLQQRDMADSLLQITLLQSKAIDSLLATIDELLREVRRSQQLLYSSRDEL